MEPDLPPVETVQPKDESPRPPTQSRRRFSPISIILLSCLVLGVAIAVLGEYSFMVFTIALFVLGPPVLVGAGLSWVGRKRNWPAKFVRPLIGTVVAVLIAACGFSFFSSFTKIRDSNKLKAMQPRQLSAAMD